MPTVGINLNEVVEKPRLPGGQAFTFHINEAELGMAKQPNKRTERIEALVKCKLFPLEPEWNDRVVYHTWSLAPGALESDSAVISIKKFFQVVGYKFNPDGSFSTEDLLTLRFIGEAGYKEGSNFPNLAKVVAGA